MWFIQPAEKISNPFQSPAEAPSLYANDFCFSPGGESRPPLPSILDIDRSPPSAGWWNNPEGVA